MAALRASLSENARRFSEEQARRKDNAKLFMYMAGFSDEPLVVEASLSAISQSYSPRSTKKETPDADLDSVLLRHLRSERRSTVALALGAARLSLMMDEPSGTLIDAVAEMADPANDPARRHAALEALNDLQPQRREARAIEAFETALSAPEAHLVSLALFALEQSSRSFAASPGLLPGTLGPRVVELTRHTDPGVRGRALRLLAEVDGLADEATRYTRARELLGDEAPYVRAVAADTLSRLGRVAAVHDLVHHVDDLALARHDLAGWLTLDGTPGVVEHALPGRKRVAEAVQYAMVTLASEGLRLLQDGPRPTDEDVLQNALLARTWYERAAPDLPAD